MGDAPQPADIRLGFSLSATVYYRRGTQGWGSTFGELPTALWPPSIESHLRIIDDRLLFEISGPPGDVVVIEANTHLGPSGWTSLMTNTLNNGSIEFIDPDLEEHPVRFYRVVMP